MAVNRCICHSIPFSKALETVRLRGYATVAQLQAELPLGTGCGLCIPYMQRGIATGESDLPVLDAAESALWLSRSGIVPEAER